MTKNHCCVYFRGGWGGGYFTLVENNTQWMDFKEIKLWFSTANSYKDNEKIIS